MIYQKRYERRKEELLKDKKINAKNRKLFADFLRFQEYKLKRKEGLSEVDERSYKTLYLYVGRMKNLVKWLPKRDWSTLTEEEIKKFIDDLEDGVIKNARGDRFTDRSLYYQMIGGKFFALIKKNQIARQILDEFSIVGRRDTNDVRFISEQDFRKIVDCAKNPIHRALLWLAFDIGENINTLLELDKSDFKRQINEDTNDPEYLIILSKDKLKRSRTPRSETTNYPETVRYLDIVLENLKPNYKKVSNKYIRGRKLSEYYDENRIFKFGLSAAESFLRSACNQSGVRCLPQGKNVTWKDLRSSMSCDLLKKGWSVDEVNARLGHKPSSRMIDKYVNYLALDRNKPKKKVYDSSLKKIEADLERQKDSNKLQGKRINDLIKENERKWEEGKLKDEQIERMRKEMDWIKNKIMRMSETPERFGKSSDGDIIEFAPELEVK